MTAISATARGQQIRRFLRENELRAWIAWRPDELVMMSGYLPYWGASLLIYFADAEPIVFVPQIEPSDHIPGGLQVKEYPWGDLKCADPYSVLVAAVSDELAKAKIAPEQAGMNSSSARAALPIQAAEHIPLPENFSERLSALAAKSGPAHQAAFFQLYLRKTPDEIQAIRLANRVANLGLQIFHEKLQPGISEVEIASAVESAIQCQIGHDEIFHSRAWAMVQSGPNSADAGRFNRSTERRLKNGDLALIELGTCVNGYWSDLTRTAPVGHLRPEAEEILSVAAEAQKAAISAVGPGVSAGRIDAAARDGIASSGFAEFFTHLTGHHVGFRYHDPGFAIVPGEAAKLEPGMIITIEPGVYVRERGAGARIEDNVLVTESGHEILSRTNGSRRT
ncbi:MAG TPA: Xaa-Pro peptidase family protein [Terriglobales bacterium]|nr:Xaa-Pro peptidase family protein [Terriglobales bacterium]